MLWVTGRVLAGTKVGVATGLGLITAVTILAGAAFSEANMLRVEVTAGLTE